MNNEVPATLERRLFGAKPLRQRLERELNPDRLERVLRVEETARQSAQKNLPPSNAPAPDANEQRIAQHFNTLRARIGQEVGAAFAVCMSRCNELRDSFVAARLKTYVE